jgi:hypothetical protein
MSEKLYRLKSNRDTILEDIGDGYFHIFWAKRFEFGDFSSFVHIFDPEDLIKLTEEEIREVIKKKAIFENL